MEQNDEAKNSDDEIKIGLSRSQAFKVTRSVLMQRTIIFAFLFFMIFKASIWASEAEEWEYIDKFLLQNIWIPWLCVNSVLFLCLLYYFYSLTQTSLRFLYVDVFYVNTFSQLVRIFFSIYMIVITLIPHSFYLSGKHELINFNRSYLLIVDLYFGFVLLDGLLNLAFVASTYFRIEAVKKLLCKYWFIRLVIYLLIDISLLCYYSYLLIVQPFSSVHVVNMVICIIGALHLLTDLKMEFCEPTLLKLRHFDDKKILSSEKVKMAVKIMELKNEVKSSSKIISLGHASASYSA